MQHSSFLRYLLLVRALLLVVPGPHGCKPGRSRIVGIVVALIIRVDEREGSISFTNPHLGEPSGCVDRIAMFNALGWEWLDRSCPPDYLPACTRLSSLMPDGADGGLRERVAQSQRSGPTKRSHCGVNDGLILNVLIVERVL